ncbi:four helix bundle protein [uncultured Duncaniella sp.]|uniref:four helix bundle protein n=1 Tax=uncultured Duncaniella sp. TaxID=2768039 RepID=UPI0025F8D76B|nr:four helix bundle protein [uncultured Duncaniella sp.]
MIFFNYERLTLWQKSRLLVKTIYTLTRSFPNEEKFALTDQIRRAVVSIASNIAEGSGRFSGKEKLHFLSVAYGSLTELSCQLTLACDMNYLGHDQFGSIRLQIEELARIMSGYREAIIRNDIN